MPYRLLSTVVLSRSRMPFDFRTARRTNSIGLSLSAFRQNILPVVVLFVLMCERWLKIIHKFYVQDDGKTWTEDMSIIKRTGGMKNTLNYYLNTRNLSYKKHLKTVCLKTADHHRSIMNRLKVSYYIVRAGKWLRKKPRFFRFFKTFIYAAPCFKIKNLKNLNSDFSGFLGFLKKPKKTWKVKI